MSAPMTPDILRSVIFAPFAQGGRTQAVFDRLLNAVALGVFKDGEQLPTEPELAARFGVSPVTLRDALSLLRRAGLVDTKRGRLGGSFVLRSAYDGARHGRARLVGLSSVDLRDLSDWRVSVSEMSAGLAADRASDEEVDVLASYVDRFARSDDAGAARLADGRILVSMAAASQSVRHTGAAVAALVEYGPLLSVAFESVSLRASVGDLYAGALAAIRDGSREDATRLIRQSGQMIATELAARAARMATQDEP